jgi:hypothetical protein
VKEGECVGDIRNEVPDTTAVDPKRRFSATDDVVKVETISLVEGGAKQLPGDFETDVFEICGGGQTVFAELIDVEGELGLDVGVRAFGIIDQGTEFRLKPGKFDGNGVVDGVPVTYVVADVVREGSDSEGEIVSVLGIAQEAEDEVAGADIVGEVGEEWVAKGIIAEVLDGAAAIGVGMGHPELLFREVRKAPEQDGPNRLPPCEIDDHLVSLDGIGNAGGGRQNEDEQGDGFDQRTMP